MREYLLVAIVAAAITFVATPGIRWAAIRWNAVTPVRVRDVHTVPIPRLGGLAMLLGFAASILIASQLPYLGNRIDYSNLFWVLVAAGIITVLGAVDDFRDLDPLTKVAGTVLAALVMAALGGVQLLFLPVFGTQTILPQQVLQGLTVLVVIATTQAVNFADGLDGLAAGTVAIAATAFFIWSYTTRPNDDQSVFTMATFISAAIVGCCLGFLPHNFHPAKLFMGDAGALLLGLLLATATISFTGNFDPSSDTKQSSVAILLPIALPVVILALPVLDVVLAFIRRGGKFWHPDKKHLHHRLMRMGHPHRRAVLLLYLWSASAAGGVLAYNYLSSPWATALLFGLLALSLGLTLGLPRIG
ncbi:undecaprenyl/decaprenyl-phosphate alpha-N-acetylglucosaminyl 1-phosphate transferase [Flexivirga sp. ID2601S]|uniref:Undecaprenyl/decaprenyl-phosphate alpha-N-acetylglucosaminyl 1-phosphate transferase n=1 Tax=Flexivirga aerilata TaxID=1656889 RepID=A0A849ARA9_9MICO|nr:undecaprenyl/decaprenyl-phosphate alpha-N-acetylglucosaminyl 1-phosphate transferase [Flexivirga aerilata]